MPHREDRPFVSRCGRRANTCGKKRLNSGAFLQLTATFLAMPAIRSSNRLHTATARQVSVRPVRLTQLPMRFRDALSRRHSNDNLQSSTSTFALTSTFASTSPTPTTLTGQNRDYQPSESLPATPTTSPTPSLDLTPMSTSSESTIRYIYDATQPTTPTPPTCGSTKGNKRGLQRTYSMIWSPDAQLKTSLVNFDTDSDADFSVDSDSEESDDLENTPWAKRVKPGTHLLTWRFWMRY